MDFALRNLELCLKLRFILDVSHALTLEFIGLDLHDCAFGGHRVFLIVFRHQNISLWLTLVLFCEDVKFLFVVFLKVLCELDGVVVCIQILGQLGNDG